MQELPTLQKHRFQIGNCILPEYEISKFDQLKLNSKKLCVSDELSKPELYISTLLGSFLPSREVKTLYFWHIRAAHTCALNQTEHLIKQCTYFSC